MIVKSNCSPFIKNNKNDEDLNCCLLTKYLSLCKETAELFMHSKPCKMNLNRILSLTGSQLRDVQQVDGAPVLSVRPYFRGVVAA